MQDIRRLLYSLKRRFGQEADFYLERDTQPNFETGIITSKRHKFHIESVIFLNENLTSYGAILKTLGQISGAITITNVAILMDGSDFPDRFKPQLKDYVIVNHGRYEILNFKEIDDYESLYFELVEYKGAITYEHHDEFIKEKLSIIEILKVAKCHHYKLYMADSLSLDENLDGYNTNSPFHQYIGDNIDFTDSMDYSYPKVNIIRHSVYPYDTLVFNEQLICNFHDIHIHDTLGFTDYIVVTVLPILSTKHVHNVSKSDTLVFSQSLLKTLQLTISLSDTLVFSDTIHGNLNTEIPNDTLVFSETFNSILVIRQSLSDNISFSDHLLAIDNNKIYVSVHDTLMFDQGPIGVNYYNLIWVLLLTDELIFDEGPIGVNTYINF